MRGRLNPFSLFCLLLLTLSGKLMSQGFEELVWATLHPRAAIKVNKLKQNADPVYNRYVKLAIPDSFSSGGKLDAFRHVFYMSVFTQAIKANTIKKLGKAHERKNIRAAKKRKLEDGEIASLVASEMDLFNNELGISIGPVNKQLSLEALAELAINAIERGEARILLRNCKGQYQTCEALSKSLKTVTTLAAQAPCLVPSNQACIH